MSRYKNGAPVGYTCPDIDSIIDTLRSIIKQMDDCDHNDTVDDLIENIESWSGDLSNIALGRTNQLEDLRSANSSLRSWGEDLFKEKEDLAWEVDRLERELAEAKEEILRLQKTEAW